VTCYRSVAFYWDSAVSCTNKTECHDITKILLNVTLNTMNLTPDPENHGHVQVSGNLNILVI